MNVEVTINAGITLTGGFSTVTLWIPEAAASAVLDVSFDQLYDMFGMSEPITLDLVLIASIVYVLDKSVPRRRADDFWTRDFHVVVPVAETTIWEHAKEALETCLTFLTGDEWRFSFTPRAEALYTPRHRARERRRGEPPRAVSLFSGGLDSLIGVIDQLARQHDRLLLIGHHDATGPAGDQRRVHQLLDQREGYVQRTDRLSVRVRPLPSDLARPGQQIVSLGREHTLRSRSFMFLALGLFAARALGEHVPLLVPENGFIAINIPLTPSRGGTCSTRTTHPFFLESFRALASLVGIQNPVVNPFELSTKGEVLASCADQAALARLTPETVSCAHPSRRAIWRRRDVRNCGYCVPCIIRRASLHHIGLDHGEVYGIDIGQGELDLESNVAADVRAVLDCIARIPERETVDDLVVASGPLPFDTRQAHVETVRRGLEELRAFVERVAPPQVAGLSGD